MANRTLQAKTYKMRRRGKSRPFSKVKVNGHSVNKERMVEYFNRVSPTTSTHKIPPTLMSMAQAKGAEAVPRAQALLAAHNLSKLVDDIDISFNVKLHEDSKTTLVLLTTPHLKWYSLLYIDFEIKLARRSINYLQREEVFHRWQHNTVKWIKFQKLSEPTVVPLDTA